MVIFHSCVSLPEGKTWYIMVKPRSLIQRIQSDHVVDAEKSWRSKLRYFKCPPNSGSPLVRKNKPGSYVIELDDGTIYFGKPKQFDGKNPWVSG